LDEHGEAMASSKTAATRTNPPMAGDDQPK